MIKLFILFSNGLENYPPPPTPPPPGTPIDNNLIIIGVCLLISCVVLLKFKKTITE